MYHYYAHISLSHSIVLGITLLLLLASPCGATNQTMNAYTVPAEAIQGQNITFVCEIYDPETYIQLWRRPPGTSASFNVAQNCNLTATNGSFEDVQCSENSTTFRQYNLTLTEVVKSYHDGLWKCRTPGVTNNTHGYGAADVHLDVISK